MIRLRFVALLAAFVVLLGGHATYVAYFRLVPEFTGATDTTHVTAVKALVAALPTPAGTTLDPYGTWCNSASAACWTSTTQQPKALLSALSKALVSRGSKIRSHECMKPEAGPFQAPDGVCVAVLDYHGSRIDLTASSQNKSDNGGRTFLRVSSPLANPTQGSTNVQALGDWNSLHLLPASWSTGATCGKSVKNGCRQYGQRSTTSPVIALTRAQVCAEIRSALRGRFFFDLDEDVLNEPEQPFCRIAAHRFQTVGDKDGLLVFVVATSIDPTSTRLSFSVDSEP